MGNGVYVAYADSDYQKKQRDELQQNTININQCEILMSVKKRGYCNSHHLSKRKQCGVTCAQMTVMRCFQSYGYLYEIEKRQIDQVITCIKLHLNCCILSVIL